MYNGSFPTGTTVVGSGDVSFAVDNQNCYLLASNTGGANANIDGTMATAFVGAKLTSEQVTAFAAALKTYMATQGVAVYQVDLEMDKRQQGFRFLRQPSRPITPMPVANSGRAAGRGAAVIGVEKASDIGPDQMPALALPDQPPRKFSVANTKSPPGVDVIAEPPGQEYGPKEMKT